MDITVYLPDEIGARAKKAELKLSRMLRDAVELELRHRAAMEELAGDGEEILLYLETPDGQTFEGRFTGSLLCENGKGDQVFVADDERLIAYSERESKYYVLETDEESLRKSLSNWCDFDGYISAMNQLGYTATVDL